MLFGANAVLLVGVLVFLFSLQTSSSVMRSGQVAGETVIAQRQVTYADHVATAARIQQSVAQVPYVYRSDANLAERHRREVGQYLSRAAAIFATHPGSAARQTLMRPFLPTDIPGSGLQRVFDLTPLELSAVRLSTLVVLSQAEAWHFAANQEQSTALALLGSLPAYLTLRERTATGELVSAFLTPTEIPDLAATNLKRKEAAAKVSSVYATLYPDQVIVRRGDLVTPAVVEQLTALGLESHHTDWHDIAGATLYATAVVAILFWYLRAFQRSVLTNPRLLLLVDAGIVLSVAAARLLTGGHVLLPFLLPVAAVSTFAAVLIAPEACIAMALAVAVLAGWVVANSFELTMYYFLSSAAGVLAIRQVSKLKQFIVAGGYITLFALATAVAFGLADHTYDFSALQEYVLAAAFNGFVSSTLALGGFALLAGFFGVTTTFQLFELGQPNQPLLRRLTSKAPGTYNHSLIVASMVEQAAEEIGADSLVAKVCALYHDVGKTANPHCFVENQLGISNIHDDLRSDESARIIRGHVTQGVRLAHQFKLPRAILDGIAEHHGTMNLTYFLHKAQQEAEGVPIDTSLYSYPGPKPQSKETALLMLADGCESAVRAAHDHSQDNIRTIVQHIFQERMHQSQLDECPVTLRDLERTQRVFCSVMNGLYHPRIQYPEPTDLAEEARPIPVGRGKRG